MRQTDAEIKRAAAKAAGWYSAKSPSGGPTKVARKLPAEFKAITEVVDELTTAVFEVGTRAHAEHLTLKELLVVELKALRARIERLEAAKGESR